MHIIGAMHGKTHGKFKQVPPSEKLINIIETMPSGTKIGIEIPPMTEFYKKFLDDAQSKNFAFEGGEYFKVILATAKKSGHEVVYLENEDLLAAQVNATIRYDKKRYVEDFMEVQKIFLCDRHKYIEEILKKTTPELAVVGFGHANSWVFDRTFIGAKYGADVTAHYMFESLFDSNPIFSPELYTLSNCQKKLVNFFYTGKFSDKTPDFVGTWDIANPVYGRFEVFLGNDTQGAIEDLLGTATFQGIINNEHATFLKEYLPVCPAAVQDIIQYIGDSTTLASNSYAGTYFSEPGISDKFIMSKKDDPTLYDKIMFIHTSRMLENNLSSWHYSNLRLHDLIKDDVKEKLKNRDTSDELPF
jgi:hypothetical protein